jgi:hypothetical protein
MYYLIKNISDSNIVIGKEVLKPDEETKVFNIDNLGKIIKKKYVKIKEIKENNEKNIPKKIENNKKENISNKKNIDKGDFITEPLEKELIESFFNFYLNDKEVEGDLELLKWFYKKIGFTKDIDKETLSLLDEANTYEELTVILLNHIYPKLLKIYKTK